MTDPTSEGAVVPFRYHDRPVLEPCLDDSWAGTAVLNPAIIRDPDDQRIHMLFRSTGPGYDTQAAGQPPPYPIYLGYAWSDDEGDTWSADYSRPALAPRLATQLEDLYCLDAFGRNGFNYANGCIEDPRLVRMDERVILTVACRMFPPGPFWQHDDPRQCMPEWAKAPDAPIGLAGRCNHTVSVAYEVNLDALRSGQYEAAFTFLCPLTNPDRDDNRDVVLFPRRLMIAGSPMVAMLHRPKSPPRNYPTFGSDSPCIHLAVAAKMEDLSTVPAIDLPIAAPIFDWESNRIGASWPPLPLSNTEWLLPYHGKQDEVVGYTQSFMILRENGVTAPDIIHRCPNRLMYAARPWELNGLLKAPCLFSCGGIAVGNELLIAYGAADTRCGVAKVAYSALTEHIRQYGPHGEISNR